jgi:hypothetical protein
MYWSREWAEEQLRRVLVEYRPGIGYSTAFWRSIREARALYERDSWHADLQERAQSPYPPELRLNIVEENFPYIGSHPFSFRNQLAKAIHRNDGVSVEHRVTAWLSSYFDILFAVNSVPHPGEKDLMYWVHQECKLVPEGFESGMQQLLARPANAQILLTVMDELVEGLREVLLRENP